MHEAKLGMMTLRITPQIAVWAEDSSGNLTTLYVTRSFAKQDWKAAKIDPDSCGRPMSLPFWLNKLRSRNMQVPTPDRPLPDAVTGATPAGSFTLFTTLPDGFRRGGIFVEVNKSFDNNDAWPAKKDMSSFNGQPPLVYSAAIDLDDTTASRWDLTLAGMSGERGDDSGLYPVDDRVTTARKMVKSITVTRL